MDMKLGIARSDLSNAFIRREKEIYADAKDKEKKKQKTKNKNFKEKIKQR